MNPTGHAAVYLSNVCADTPTHLRACRPGELGIVLSRYHKIDGYDWLAIPVLPYLYAVDRVEDVPQSATPDTVAALRDSYRRKHLLALAPDSPGGEAPAGEWIQLVGSSYNREIHGFTVATSSEQDGRLIALFNDRRNVSHFNLFFNNCADLSRGVLDLYYPGAVHRSFIADFGFTTPKHLAKTLTSYANHHPETAFAPFVIPQIPGTVPRSRPIKGVTEALLKSKKYLLPLAVLHPEFTGGLAVAYISRGRYTFPAAAQHMTAADFASSPKTLSPEPALPRRLVVDSEGEDQSGAKLAETSEALPGN